MSLPYRNSRIPSWRPKRQLVRHRMNTTLASWLLDTDSLTHRFKALGPERFQVRMVSQSWVTPAPDEARSLSLSPREACVARHVVLMMDELNCVFARTIIPAKTLSGRTKKLTKLGTTPLGGVLFSDKRIRRHPIEIACVTPQYELYQLARHSTSPCPDALWARRSVFSVQNHPLLVHEVFLPELLNIG